jgi:hypothetical protein
MLFDPFGVGLKLTGHAVPYREARFASTLDFKE